MKTKAVFFVRKGQVEVREVDVPEIGPSDVLMKTKYSGISVGTERWWLLDRIHAPDGSPEQAFPLIPGYQRSGFVEKVGTNVHDLEVGDRVFSYRGKISGGHIQHYVCPREGVLKLPSSVSLREASELPLAQVGYNGASRPTLTQGDLVVVIGDGIVGQTAAQVFRHRGAKVILSGHHKNRLDLAKDYSADIVLNSKEEDLSSIVMKERAEGADVVVEAVGYTDLVRQLLQMVKDDGRAPQG